jgi:hypothetical protein
VETHGVDPRVLLPATIGRKIEVTSVGCRLPEQMAGLRDALVASGRQGLVFLQFWRELSNRTGMFDCQASAVLGYND